MAMTLYCSVCIMSWSPYQCTDGCCPVCGGGTERRFDEDVSADAPERHRAVLVGRIARERSELAHRQFEEYYAEREVKHWPDDHIIWRDGVRICDGCGKSAPGLSPAGWTIEAPASPGLGHDARMTTGERATCPGCSPPL
jgi:hypothetical protein